MAQVTGDSSYDWEWRQKWEASLMALRDLMNAWALKKEIPGTEAAAVVLRILRMKHPFAIQRLAAEPLSVRRARTLPLERELEILCPTASRDDLERAATDLAHLMDEARQAWTRDGDGPDETAVLQAATGLLFDRDLCRKAPLKGDW